jgi:Putative Zn-dependent protease, contains TPR repeats
MPKQFQRLCVLRTCSLFLLSATNIAGVFGQASALSESSEALYRGDYKKATELAKAHLRRFPNDASVRVVLARVEFARAEFPQAFEDLQKAVVSDPKNVDALYYLSLTARELSQRESQRLFSLSPDSSFVHRLLGEAALTADNQSQAEQEFQKALKANPQSVEVLTELADLKRSQAKFEEAITYYTKAEQFDPLSYDAAYGLGICYAYTQQYPLAIERLQKAVTLAPNSSEGRFALGKALFQNGQFEAAIQELKAAVRVDPRMKQAYVLLGRSYSKLGRPEEAKAAFRKFDELDRAESQGAERRLDSAPLP